MRSHMWKYLYYHKSPFTKLWFGKFIQNFQHIHFIQFKLSRSKFRSSPTTRGIKIRFEKRRDFPWISSNSPNRPAGVASSFIFGRNFDVPSGFLFVIWEVPLPCIQFGYPANKQGGCPWAAGTKTKQVTPLVVLVLKVRSLGSPSQHIFSLEHVGN